MPMSVRILCKAIEMLILKKFPATSRTIVLIAVSNFLFTTWLLPEIYYQDKVVASGVINEDHNRNAVLVQQLIQRILRGEYLTQDVVYKKEVNKIIRSLHDSVENYIEEVLNISEHQVKRLIDK
jgi:hypothetical protein